MRYRGWRRMSKTMKSEKRVLVPRLRFPDFRDAEAWSTKLGDVVFDQISNKNHSSNLPVLAITQEYGAIPRDLIDYHVSVSEKSIKSYKVVEVGDFIISLRSFQGGIEFSKYRGVCSPAYVILRLKHGYVEDYFRHYLKTNRFIGELTKNLEGLRDGKMISYKQFSEVELHIPQNTEQQKIADCLSSLDALIAAQADKIDALKTHKKGLMQQLFPREGETVPRLRFPEFRDAGGWGAKNFYDLLEDVVDFRGRTPKKLGMDWGGGDIISLSANNVKNGYIDLSAECNLGSTELYEKWMGGVKIENGDIIFTMEAPLGNALLVPDSRKYILSQRVVAFKTKPTISNYFLIQLIWSPRFRSELEKLSTGSAAKGINQKTLKTVDVLVPESEEEQQKIADCLTSLDALIAGHTEQLDSLKAHKKGLMQQLFPSLEGEIA